ncbi:MAG: hypothetical protein J6F30_10975 [Cellulosilyticum sp.]|nr:hypothetical protein [Cellulosilyticum sp.]
MGEQIACFIKRKCGTCLWHEICEIDQKILEKKTYFNGLQHQMKYDVLCLEQHKYTVLLNQPLRLYDGYNWNAIEKIDIKKQDQPLCCYQKYGCKDLYTLKQDVLSYHTERLRQMVSEYNKWTVLLLALKGQWQSKRIDLNTILIGYEKSSINMLVYLTVEQFKKELSRLAHQESMELSILYTDESLKVHQEKITLYFRSSDEMMYGTYLAPIQSEFVYLQIKIETRHIQKKLVEPIIQCLFKIKQYLKGIIGKKFKLLAGSYIELESIDTYHANQLIKQAVPLGYQPIGQIKNGQFKSQQLLVHHKK